MRAQMVRDGYVKLPRAGWDDAPSDPDRLDALVSIIDRLEAEGLPPQFMLVYDEVWEVVNAVGSALRPVYGLQNVMALLRTSTCSTSGPGGAAGCCTATVPAAGPASRRTACPNTRRCGWP
ncbi:unnamed protein product [Prorocentrum cordatum]|uniref:Uncharacterized protein n=1 Tax=Prorocentrum cordatum TaxID=2364126 RepID=A0ABN9WQZ7_9DINO|nr:unnamed protein product [Polarella glacialis]